MAAKWKGWLVVGLLVGTMVYAIAEEIVLTTYYPSPRGVYNELRTVGNVQIGHVEPPAFDPAPRLYVVQNDPSPALRVDDDAFGGFPDSSPFLIDQDGNVGIGTTGPGYPLHVVGAAARNNPLLTVETTGAAGGNAGVRQGLLVNIVGNTSSGVDSAIVADFQQGGISLMAVRGSGNVGIGTQTPATRLDVNGPIRAVGTGGNVVHACRLIDQFVVGLEASICCGPGEYVMGGGGGCDNGALRNTRASSEGCWEITCQTSGNNRIRVMCCQL